jgi:hypothetical protein
MVLLRKKESKFGAPEGIYLGKFLGVEPFKGDGKPRVGRDGRPMEPGIEWQFEIVEGEHAGQIVGRITSAVATTKNSCGELQDGLVGRTVGTDEDIETGNYVGFLYQVVIGKSKENPDKTQVTKIVRAKGGAPPAPAAIPGYENRPAPPPRPPSPAAPPPPPPPPAAAAPPPPPPAEPLYWVSDGTKTDPTPQPASKLRADYQFDPATLGRWQVCRVGTSDWFPLAGSKIVEGLAGAMAPPAPPFPVR